MSALRTGLALNVMTRRAEILIDSPVLGLRPTGLFYCGG